MVLNFVLNLNVSIHEKNVTLNKMISSYSAQGGAFFDDVRALAIPFSLILAQKGLAKLASKSKSGSTKPKRRASSKKAATRKTKVARSVNAKPRSVKAKKARSVKAKKSRSVKAKTTSRKTKKQSKKQMGGDCGCAGATQSGGSGSIMDMLSKSISSL